MRILKQHLTKACKFCGEVFSRKPKITYTQWETAEFCSRSCVYKWRFDKKERHPRWKGGSIIKQCEQCNKQFETKRYRATVAKFCSSACKIKAQDHGISSINEKARKSNHYKKWRTTIFQRDDYTCQICGNHGGSLHADHIKPFAIFPKLRFDINNGRTLCANCHKGTPTYGRLALAYIKGY